MSMLNKGGGGSPGGYDVIKQEWMPGMENLSGQQASYLSSQLQRMQEGQEPEWWSKYAPILKKRQVRGLEESMYGVPGERKGAYAGQMEAGALAGLGGGATVSRTRPLYSEYLRRGQEIDETIAGLGANIMQQGEQTYLSSINQAQKFQPMGQVVPISGTQPQASPWASIAGQVSSMIPWSSIGAGGGTGSGLQTFEQLRRQGLASTPPAGQYYGPR
jgi:hypothetical protein